MVASTFGIATNWVGANYVQPITAEMFSELRSAKDQLLACLAIEEAYDVVILNYLSFEQAMLAAVLDDVVDRRRERHELEEARRELDRHLVNLLAAGQMFSDHVKRHATQSFGRASPELAAVRAALKTQHVALVGFRATKHLRDAVLHRTLPISSWTRGGKWLDLETPQARRQHSYSVAFDPAMLSDDRHVDPRLVADLQGRAEPSRGVPWAPVVREYVEGLSYVLRDVRSIFTASETASAELLDATVKGYRAHYGGKDRPLSVSAVELQGDLWAAEVPLEFDFGERVQSLRRRNQPMVNLHKLEIKG